MSAAETADLRSILAAQLNGRVPHLGDPGPSEPPSEPDDGGVLVPLENRRRTSFTAAELMAMEFPEPRYAIPGLVPEGLTVLAGSPKVGKSWFAYNAGLSVAQGGRAFGRIGVEAGGVLYLALEDPPRRLQQRLGIMLAGQPAPEGLTLATACDRFPAGIDRIDRWLRATPDARLVIVDVFAKVRPQLQDKGSQYLADYGAVSPLKALADEHGVAIVLLHHTRKMGSEDFLDTVSGTNGIAGAADTIMVLKRARNAADGILSITGRDVNEAEHALTFDAALGTWRLLDGPASDYQLGDTRRSILSLLRDEDGLTPKAIAERLDMNEATVRQTCRRMADDDQLDTDGAGHYMVPLSPVTPVTGVTRPGDDAETSDTPPPSLSLETGPLTCGSDTSDTSDSEFGGNQ